MSTTTMRLEDERWARIRTTGQTVAWDDAKAYLAARAEGSRPGKPTVRSPSKQAPAPTSA